MSPAAGELDGADSVLVARAEALAGLTGDTLVAFALAPQPRR